MTTVRRLAATCKSTGFRLQRRRRQAAAAAVYFGVAAGGKAAAAFWASAQTRSGTNRHMYAPHRASH
jgi:hypothetical protein